MPSLLILVHFPAFTHISSCAFKEQAGCKAGGGVCWEEEGSWELISLLLCIADCLVCSVDACLSYTVLNTSNPFHEMGQFYRVSFMLLLVGNALFLCVDVGVWAWASSLSWSAATNILHGFVAFNRQFCLRRLPVAVDGDGRHCKDPSLCDNQLWFDNCWGWMKASHPLQMSP